MAAFLTTLYRAVKGVVLGGCGVMLSFGLVYRLTTHDIYQYEKKIKIGDSSVEYRIDVEEHQFPFYFVTGEVNIKVNNEGHVTSSSFFIVGEDGVEVFSTVMNYLSHRREWSQRYEYGNNKNDKDLYGSI